MMGGSLPENFVMLPKVTGQTKVCSLLLFHLADGENCCMPTLSLTLFSTVSIIRKRKALPLLCMEGLLKYLRVTERHLLHSFLTKVAVFHDLLLI